MKKEQKITEVELLGPAIIGRPVTLRCAEYPGKTVSTSALQSVSETQYGYLYETANTIYDVTMKHANLYFDEVRKPDIMLNERVTFEAKDGFYQTDEVVSARIYATGCILITRTARYELHYAM